MDTEQKYLEHSGYLNVETKQKVFLKYDTETDHCIDIDPLYNVQRHVATSCNSDTIRLDDFRIEKCPERFYTDHRNNKDKLYFKLCRTPTFMRDLEQTDGNAHLKMRVPSCEPEVVELSFNSVFEYRYSPAAVKKSEEDEKKAEEAKKQEKNVEKKKTIAEKAKEAEEAKKVEEPVDEKKD